MKRFIVTFKDEGNCEIIQYRENAATVGEAFAQAYAKVRTRTFFNEVDQAHIGEVRNWKGKAQ